MTTMKLGDKGLAVQNVQKALIACGFEVDVDGVYGPITEAAVRRFQKSRGLTIDGIAGPATLNALKSPRYALPIPPVTRLVALSVVGRLARAWAWTAKKAKYILGEGGRGGESPLTPDKNGTLGSDCVGFVLWCMGIDRYQPKLFKYYDGWMNTDSIIEDARTGVGGGHWKLLKKPQVGCLVIFPSIHKNGKMTRMGHVGIVVEVPGEWPDDFASWTAKERTNLLKLVKVIDCNASLGRKLSGKAIGQLTAAASWNKPDAVWVELA